MVCLVVKKQWETKTEFPILCFNLSLACSHHGKCRHNQRIWGFNQGDNLSPPSPPPHPNQIFVNLFIHLKGRVT